MWFQAFHGSREAQRGGWTWTNHSAFLFVPRLRKDLVWLEELTLPPQHAPLHRWLWLPLPGFTINTWTLNMSLHLSISSVTVHYRGYVVASGSIVHTEVWQRRHWECADLRCPRFRRSICRLSSPLRVFWQPAWRHGGPWTRTRPAELGRHGRKA